MRKLRQSRFAVSVMVVGGAALGLSACASTRRTEAHRVQMEREAVVTVEAIDVPNRLVTARNASGESLTVYVDESNKAFPQAKVGDQVRIRFVESMAFQLKKTGDTIKMFSVFATSFFAISFTSLPVDFSGGTLYARPILAAP